MLYIYRPGHGRVESRRRLEVRSLIVSGEVNGLRSADGHALLLQDTTEVFNLLLGTLHVLAREGAASVLFVERPVLLVSVGFDFHCELGNTGSFHTTNNNFLQVESCH